MHEMHHKISDSLMALEPSSRTVDGRELTLMTGVCVKPTDHTMCNEGLSASPKVGGEA
jgi:hypothetical protein